MSKPIYRVSSISRPLDARYGSNRAVLMLLPLILIATAGWRMSTGESLMAAGFTGLGAMFAAFLIWALGRELDPDRNPGAFIAMAAVVPLVWLGNDLSLWTLAFVLMAVRVVNRTVGNPVKLGDMAVVLILAGLAVFRDGYSEMGYVAGLALALDAFLDRKRTLNLVGAMIAVAFSMWNLIELEGDLRALLLSAVEGMPQMMLYAALGILALGVVHALLLGRINSVGDATEEPLSGLRVRGGILIAALAGLAVLTEGEAGLMAGLGLYAAIAGVVLGRFWPGKA
ncbi:hypothetical protein [Maricaulis sp.]|uniref:hypothetical protein n=1 Tax=Maricaulis sp. TaxID=1486257 RepID=UPI001B046F0B|nr:hypothetical protein [Maricaulis sp.]MBO6798156.1 hypothetical protein [Maricaulis sp.]